MAIDFPNSPVNGDTFSVGSRTWEYQDGVWSFVVEQTGASVSVSDTAPSSPSEGDLWYRSSSGQTLIYIDSQWAEVGPTMVDDVLQRVEAKGDLIVAAAGDLVQRLGVGVDDQVLMADSGETLGVKWATMDLSPYLTSANAATIYLPSATAASTYVENAIVDAKGDLIVATAADTVTRLGVGTNGQALVADSSSATGLAWGDVSAGDTPILLNTNIVSSNFSIPSGYNGVSAGPVTIADGVTVTIADGSEWSIV